MDHRSLRAAVAGLLLAASITSSVGAQTASVEPGAESPQAPVSETARTGPAPVPAPQPAGPLSANMLANPSFEGGMYHASMSNFIGEGWSYWYQGRPPEETRWYWMPEPEFGLIADRPGQMKSGHKSQRWFNTWAIHNAGVYQRVKVPENAWLKFTIWMFNWSSQEDVFGLSEAFHHKWVGIDPTGGTDPFSPNIVWGNEDRTMDVWVQLGVIAQARGEWVTVFVREQPEYAVKHNDVLIDDAELVVVPAPAGGAVVQPVAQSVRRIDGTQNSSPESAVELGRTPIQAAIEGSTGGKHAYFKFKYPGGDTPYRINLHVATPGAAEKVRFRVYGPRRGHVYATSGTQPGLTPNVTADLLNGEAGEYVVQVHNANPDVTADYRIWLTGKGLVGEVRAE